MPPQSRWDEFKGNHDLARFLAQLQDIPWFANLGKTVRPSDRIAQIVSWDEWPGPEDLATNVLHCRQQALYEERILSSGVAAESASRLWVAIQAAVLRLTSQRVPYDANKDTWHAPNAAVWHAAWTASLVGVCLFTRHPVPPDLSEQWKWFVEGHWPCSWAGEDAEGRRVVF